MQSLLYCMAPSCRLNALSLWLLYENGLFVPTVEAGHGHLAIPYRLTQGELDTQVALLCWDS